MDDLKPLPESSMCWLPLFIHTVIAVQFPLPSRGDGVGLEISPVLMAHLAGIVMVVEFQGGMILKGLSTALIPMRRCDEGAAIQWHLFHTDRPDGSLDLKDPETGAEDINFLKVPDGALLFETKAYLGWCKPARVLLGTSNPDYGSIGWSAWAPGPSKFAVSGFSIGLASAGLGIFGPSVTMNFSVANAQRNRFMDIKQQLEDRLEFSINKPALIYDTSTRCGWLVPTTSLLLHMIHVRHRELRPTASAPVDTESAFASTEGNAGLKAYEVLMAQLQASSDTSWKDTLSIFFTALDMALKDVIELKKPVTRNETSEIYGYELLDVVRAESPFHFSQRKPLKESGGWASVARQVGYVLFCSGLGDAIVPAPGGNHLCEPWMYNGHFLDASPNAIRIMGSPKAIRSNDHWQNHKAIEK
ncbi:MAG: hypothetical protein LQ344_006105 [Seirophora lacunosa]|nr:MAG: hypothetical protein LQ344_006105 [Seirophora lacunosa]